MTPENIMLTEMKPVANDYIIVSFYLHKMPRAGKSTEIASGLVVIWAEGFG